MAKPIPYGKYLLLDRISVGGMAEVYKAKTFGVAGFEKLIAIKRILPTMAEDKDFIEMFIDEAKIAGQLSHANLCHIFELGRIDNTHFIAMEYVWGKDLLQIQNHFRRARQTCPVPMACHVASSVCAGLDYAHRRKDATGQDLAIIHRDVSPQNVLVSYDGEIKIIDFGIAKAETRSSKTQAGVLKGKFGYMSPEQVRGMPLDQRSDIFAIGTLLYEMLAGDRLFVGETDFATLEAVRNADIRPLSMVNSNVPEALETIVMKALAREPDDRYQWASSMQGALAGFLAQSGLAFGTAELSDWMRAAFAKEIAREQEVIELYKQIGPDSLDVPLPEDLEELPPDRDAPPIRAGQAGEPTLMLEDVTGAGDEVLEEVEPEPVPAIPFQHWPGIETGGSAAPARAAPWLGAVAIGAAAAVAMAALVVFAPQRGSGTALVVVADVAGDVLIDGALRGAVGADAPLVLDDLEGGPHAVVLRVAGRPDARRDVAVREGRVAVLRIRDVAHVAGPSSLPSPAPVAPPIAPAEPAVSAAPASAPPRPHVPAPAAAPAPRRPEEPRPAPKAVPAAAKPPAQRPARSSDGEWTALPDAVAPKPDGYLIANTQPWARVWIDGKDTGKTTPIAPRARIALKPGKHKVTFVVGAKRFDFDVVIVSGETARLIRQLDAN
ncbi:MAG: serine/threonine-protein kinase, partial [Myxococcota bacterium]